MTTADLLPDLSARFPEITERASLDWPAFNVPASILLATMLHLRDGLGFDMLVDVTAVDWENETPRFSAVYHLLSTHKGIYLRVVTDCEEIDDEPHVPSVSSVWPAANWHERETYDMLGILFDGHPDLRRILMWDGYPHFPLRKEFPLAGIETDLPDAEIADETGANLIAAPMMGGPFVAPQEGPMSHREPRARDESWTESQEKPLR
jgi:NADH-quinone oxidoreductase subunit C